MEIRLYKLYSILFFLCSCTSNIDINEGTHTDQLINEITELEIPNSFNYKTTEEIEIEIEVKSIEDQVLSGIKVSFFTDNPDFGGVYLASALTDLSGNINTKIQIPTYIENLFVHVHSVGFANQKMINVTPYINLEFGGLPSDRSINNSNRMNFDPIPISDNYYYMGSYNEGHWKGLPHYLEDQGDNLSQEFLNSVSASLPDRRVPWYNPEYLTTGNELDIEVIESSEVFVTFVGEGAGYRNALGYYVFETNNPPANVSEIDSIFVVLPNASLVNSYGELNAGDKIKLGDFDPGQTISWVLFQNAWTGTGVDVNATKFFSRIDFNTVESDPNKRQHTVQLADFGNQLLLNGFEDMTRSTGSDDDFNDLIFYVSANPWEGINTGDMPITTPVTDSDGDGITDENDDFPDDPLRALRNTYEGSLAFEDLWPAQGDYDFNDMVIDYEIDHILNGSNLLVDIEAEWTVKALFASFDNGFGIQLNNLASNDVNSVSGVNINNGIISQNGNGTEANQENATVIIFDSAFDVVQASGSLFPHTSPTTSISTTINFDNPVSQSVTGYPPYNPFIFVNGDRSKEVHLPGRVPTDLADLSFFGTSSDASNFDNGYYYKTFNGLPWAINIPESFDFPEAGIPINEAYYNFALWAISGGNSNQDWYRDLPGNRNESKIY